MPFDNYKNYKIQQEQKKKQEEQAQEQDRHRKMAELALAGLEGVKKIISFLPTATTTSQPAKPAPYGGYYQPSKNQQSTSPAPAAKTTSQSPRFTTRMGQPTPQDNTALNSTLDQLKQTFIQPWRDAVQPGGALRQIGDSLQYGATHAKETFVDPLATAVQPGGALRHDVTHPFAPSQTAKPAVDAIQEMANPTIKIAQTMALGADKANQLEASRRAKEAPGVQAHATELNMAGDVLTTWAGGEVLAPLRFLKGLKVLNQTKSIGGAGLKATLPEVAASTGQRVATSVANAGIVGAGAQAAQGAFMPNQTSDNPAVDLGKGVRRFGGNQYKTAGYGAKMLGFDNLGNDLIKVGEQNNAGFESTHEFKGGWSDMLDPYYWSGMIGENAPTSLAFIPLGLAGRAAGAAGASAMKLGGFGTAVMEGLGVSAATAPMEAAMEASGAFEQVYKEALNNGMTEEQAKAEGRKAGGKTFWGNMALLGVTNAVEFAHIFGPASRALNRMGADTLGGKMLAGAVIEGGQEMGQQAIQDSASGKPVDWLSPDYVSQGIFGAAMGVGFGLAGAHMDTDSQKGQDHIKAIQNKVIERLDDETRADIIPVLNDARAQGVPEEVAMQQIMDTIAEQHPKGQQIIQDATREVAQSAQDLMNHERFSEAQMIVPNGATPQQKEALRQVDPYGTLIGYDPVPQGQGVPSPQPQQTPSSRPQGPVQPFEQGEAVRLAGMNGLFQITNDQQGKKRDIIGQDGKKRSVPPQALQKFDTLAKGDQVNVAGRDGVFTVSDMRDGKKIRVTDQQGNTLHFGANELSPSFSAPVQAAAPQATAMENIDIAQPAPVPPVQATAEQPAATATMEAPPAQQQQAPAVETPPAAPAASPEPAATTTKPAVGNTVTLRGMGDQQFTVDSIKGNMLSLTGEKGGKLEVHNQAVVSVESAAPAAEQSTESTATAATAAPAPEAQQTDTAPAEQSDDGHIILWVPDANDPVGKSETREVHNNVTDLVTRLRGLDETQLRHIAEQYAITGASKQKAENLPVFITDALVRNQFQIPRKGIHEIFTKSMEKIKSNVPQSVHDRIQRMVKNFQDGTVDYRIDQVLGDKQSGFTAINYTDLKTDKRHGLTFDAAGRVIDKFDGYSMKRDFPKTLAEWKWDNHSRTILPVGEADWTGWALQDRARAKRAEDVRASLDDAKWQRTKPEMHGDENHADFAGPNETTAEPQPESQTPEANVEPAQAQPVPDEATTGFSAGDEVNIIESDDMADWVKKMAQANHPFEIMSANDDGTYNVKEHGGNRIESVHVRAVERAVGDIVYRKNKRMSLYKITAINGDTATIERFSEEETVPLSDLRTPQNFEEPRPTEPKPEQPASERDELDEMSSAELKDEAVRLRVPSWGSKTEIAKRIRKAYRAREALGDLTSEELHGFTVDQLEAIMRDADMLPTENNQPRNKDNHIRRLLEWRDGKAESVDSPVPENNATQGDARAQQIADKLKELIRAGTQIKSSDLFRISDEVYRGSQAKGTYSPKDAYDALELAVNQYLLEQTDIDLTARDTQTVKENVAKLAALTDKLPTQTKRTEDQERFQQFSTPPAIAYTASWVANIASTDTVLEPSAGIGGLAVFAKANGAQVVVNELDPRRLEVLKNMPFEQFFKEDGEQINNILPKTVKPSVVIMNPPFSTSATRGVTKTKNSFNHVDQALKRLEPGGRLVAILGLGRQGNSKGFTDWIKQLNDRGFTVRAIVGIDGKNYTKYGTSYNVQFVVIDKASVEAEMIQAHVDTLDKAIDALGGVADEDKGTATGNSASEPNANQSTGVANTGENPSRRPDTGNHGQRNPSGSASTVGDSGRSDPDTVHESGSNVQPPDEVRGPVDTTANDEPVNDVGRNEPDNTGDATGDTQGSSDESAGSVGGQEDRAGDNSDAGRSGPVKPKELTDTVFEDYTPRKLNLKGTKRHPGQLAESAAMSAIDPPDLSYKLQLSQDIITSGKLSDAQLEAVAYAGQAHSQMLADGKKRKGIFVGDGTGLGKGREMAGIIMDNFAQGRTKAVWVSENDGLLSSARRDWVDLGGQKEEVFKKPKKGEAIKQSRGVFFTTYNTLASGSTQNVQELEAQGKQVKQSRLDQLAEWVGPNFDGVIVFDEAHNMANAVAQKGARGVKKAAARALAGIDLQTRLPNARIVYASATGATEVSNLAYGDRLGLWGTGTAFPNQIDFINKINAGGIAAMELVARDMKAMGVYIARTLSYDGVEYQKITHDLTNNQRETYDLLAHSWQIVLQNINKALEVTGVVRDGQTLSGNAKGQAVGQFWGAQQRFFNQVLTAMQMPSVLAEAKKDLADGKAIVMQLVNTNEASQDRGIAKIEEEEGDLEDLDLTPRDILLQFIDKSFPTQQYEEYTDDKGNVRSRPVEDSQGRPVINAEAQAMKDELMARLSSVKVPEGPLEMVINTFGVANVAEITGRGQRVIEVQNENTGRTERVLEKRTSHQVEADADAFMDGKKNILMFSNAGGTGRSYHADRTKQNQKQRMHYLIQAGWEATKAVQGFGRTHRSNQASIPVYKLFTTNLKGQMRFVSSIARRLDQLGALTKGQRQTGSQGMFNAADNLESNIAKRALVQFYGSLAHDQISYLDKMDVLGKMGLADKILDSFGNFNDNANELTEVTKFLNRILTLESGLQNDVFDAFQSIVGHMTQIALQDGTLDTGLENLKADTTKIVSEQDIRTDEATGSVTKYYQLETGTKTIPMRLKELTKKEDYVGTYRNERSKAIRTLHEAGNRTLASGAVVKRFFMQGPEKFDYKYIDEEELGKSKWEKLPTQSEVQEELDDMIHALQAAGMSKTEATARAKTEFLSAEDAWQKAVTALPKFRTDTVHMISGTLLPVWDRLPTDRVRVVRALTDDGQILLGRIIAENAIDQTLHNLGAEKRAQEIDTDSLADKIIDGYTVYLANGWKLIRRKLSGEWRIEIDGGDGSPLWKHAAELREAGVFTERIAYDTRFFVPTSDEGNAVIKALIKHRPISEVVPPSTTTRNQGNQQGFAAPLTQTQPVQTPAPASGKPVKRADIYKHINEKFKVPIGTGRYKRRALGIYTKMINEIRTKNYGDFIVLTHELGHRLDDLYGFSKQPTFSTELFTLAASLKIPSSMPKPEVRAEGFAEFMRRYFFDPASAQQDAPLLYDHFEDTMRQHRQYTATRELYDMLQNWYQQGARERIQGVTDKGVPKSAVPTHKQLSDRLFEELGGIDRGINRVVGGRKNAPKGKENPYHAAWRSRGAAGRIKAFLHYGVTDEDGNKIGKSLEEILNPKNVPDLQLFTDYLLALRAKELHDQGRSKTPISVDDSDYVIDLVENGPDGQKYIDASQDLYDYQDAVTDVLLQGGFLTQSTVNQWRNDHLYYVPFYRVMEESGTREDSAGRSGGTGGNKLANLNNPIHGMKSEGSARNIINPLESIIKNTYLFLSLASRNAAGVSLVDFLRNTPNSASIGAIVPPKTKATAFSLFEIANALESAGFDLSDPNIDLDKYAAVFRQTFNPSPTNRILNVWENGSITQVQIRDEAMYESYLLLDTQPIPWLYRVLGLPNNILKAGVVLSPAFIPKNAMRGVPTMLMQSDSFTNPKDYADLFPMMAKNFFSTMFRGEDYWKWMSSGGAHSTLNSITNTYLKDSSDKILRSNWKDILKREGKTLGVGAILKGLRYLSDLVGDAPIRMTEYQKAVEKTGDQTLAAVRSRDVDVDFNRYGSNTRIINALNAFFNPALQGQNRVWRTFRDHPYRTMIRGSLFLTLPTWILYFINRDDEDYWRLPQWERDLFWIIPTGLEGPLKYAKIPIPFEWGLLFKVLPERIMASNAGYGDKGGKAFDQSVQTMLGVFVPSVVPTILEPLIEWVTGYKLTNLSATPVVPERFAHRAPEQQFRASTSETAKAIGKATNTSPLKVENLVSGVTGTLGMIGLKATDEALKATGVTHPPAAPTGSNKGLGLFGSHGLFAKSFFTSPETKSSQVMNDFYKQLKKAEADHKSKPMNKWNPPASLSKMRQVSERMAAIRAIQELVQQSPNSTGDEKRAFLDKSDLALNDLAAKAIGQTPKDAASMRKIELNAVHFISIRSNPNIASKYVDKVSKSK